MSGRELFGDENPTEAGLPVLPSTVAAAHLAACAAELAAATSTAQVRERVGSLAEVEELLAGLLAGQRQVAVTLGQLADHVAGRTPDLPSTALAEVLRAASVAAGHAAGALAESGPVLDLVRRAEDDPTR